MSQVSLECFYTSLTCGADKPVGQCYSRWNTQRPRLEGPTWPQQNQSIPTFHRKNLLQIQNRTFPLKKQYVVTNIVYYTQRKVNHRHRRKHTRTHYYFLWCYKLDILVCDVDKKKDRMNSLILNWYALLNAFWGFSW